ncbi:PREDICTED: uncharacterized protein LOC104805483 [Tarenaya hassleriana]|uniref:uncharacterized protein LOC104805483 n=1 Tax=Tarenaya hassleriana TaxID=28532 RepID=UPI0008FD1092|nr:PREDICTED: uncharacterized protein LOC104805483 [Tarenaya hassleriana]
MGPTVFSWVMTWMTSGVATWTGDKSQISPYLSASLPYLYSLSMRKDEKTPSLRGLCFSADLHRERREGDVREIEDHREREEEMAASSRLSSFGIWRREKKTGEWGCRRWPVTEVRPRPSAKCHVASAKPATYSSRISTDLPLYESPQALFDDYLEDKSRVFAAMFPDKRRSRRLSHEEWRIQMLPINFLFVTVWPVVDMRLRCRSNGHDYPIDVPPDITKVLELDMTRWELQGLDKVMEPTDFSLGVRGALYPDRRRGRNARLKGRLEMNISFVLPPVLELVPEDVRKNVATAVLTSLVENMKDKVNGSLLADYSRFKNERTLHK